MGFLKNLPFPIIKTAKLYLTGLAVFTIFRILLLLNEWGRIGENETPLLILKGFWMGARFDTVILCYLLSMPFLLWVIGYFIPKAYSVLNKFNQVFLMILGTLAFVISAADIPYFKQFFSRFSITALEWMDSPSFVFGMIAEEPKYWLFILPFLVIIYIYIKTVRRITTSRSAFHRTKWSSILFLLTAALLFVGIRGRLAHKSPIRIGTAYFSQSAFVNQLGLNPNFTFLKSYLLCRKSENKPIDLMPTVLAFAETRRHLGLTSTGDLSIARSIDQSNLAKTKQNVVLILMESMSAYKLGYHGNSHNLTPFLDSLINEGVYYENAYSSGIHTFNGIFSSIFGLPAIYRKHPMKGMALKEYDGLFEYTKKNGYQTIYFCTHDGQFDNVEGFLTANYCDEVIASDDYPSEEIKTTLGVPDDYMFKTAIQKLTNLSQNNQPFASVIMTASDHGPYYVPPYFSPSAADIKQQIVQYADWSLRQFFEEASEQAWYDNTLFVLAADHGAPMNATYDMPLAYNHIPLLFYSPSEETTPKIKKELAGQLDIFPTIMDYLELPYVNNTLGINLNDSLDRPFIYFNGDDKYGVVNDSLYLIHKQTGENRLYNYRERELIDRSSEHPVLVDSMTSYTEAQLEVYQHILFKNNEVD